MAKYKPGKSGVASRKLRNLKKDIKSEYDKDRIKELKEKLAILMAKQNTAKKPPKGTVRYFMSLSHEHKSAKQVI